MIPNFLKIKNIVLETSCIYLRSINKRSDKWQEVVPSTAENINDRN